MSVLRVYYPKALGGKHKIAVERFNSAAEITELSNTREITNGEFTWEFTRDKVRRDFHGTNSFEEACDLLKYGYKEIVPKLEQSIEMTAKGDATKASFRNDVVGFAPVVPLAMIGVPNCMVNNFRKPIKNKVVNIYYDRTALGGRTTKQITDTAVKFIALLIDLELQGYRFNLTVVKTQSNTSQGTDMLLLKIKDANTPLDLQRMTYPLVHPAFARVTCWDWYSRCPIATFRSGLGHNITNDFNYDKVQRAIEEMFGEKCIYVSLEDMIDRPMDYLRNRITDANQRFV